MSGPSYSLAELAAALQLDYRGDGAQQLSGLAPLATASEGQLSFLSNVKFKSSLANTRASALIVHPDLADDCHCGVLLSSNPYVSYAKASALFDPLQKPRAGIHPSAVVVSDKVHDSVAIAANCVIEEGAEIAEGCVIGPGTVVGANSRIGRNTLLHANVTLYHGVILGEACVVHSGVVIGADGFGFAPSKDEGWVKIHQLGSVRIGDRVEIGANSCIDRGALTDTLIGDGVILDDQTMIAHNVEIGEGTAMAGCCQVAGSTKIGKYCTLAGNVGVIGHIEIVDNVHVTARTMVSKSILTAGSYSGAITVMESALWRKNMVRLGKLDELYRRVVSLEKQLQNREGND